MRPRPWIVVIFAFALAGCGTTLEDRGISGAGIGAAAGTVLGAVTGLGLWQGALLGAGVGAATGALTEARDVDLGKPLWRRGGASHEAGAPRAAPVAAASTGSVVKDVQASLAAAGYDPGPADGRMGAKTRAAIIRYQQEKGLAVDGTPSPQLLQHLKGGDA
jgi:peptidoglycan hydrolase-like protein with peptidoglycan-binding domain